METFSEIVGLFWSLIVFLISLLWGLAWFIIRDLVSTLLWAGVVVWIVLALRYRSVMQGALAMMRYARAGLAYGGRWVRGRPADKPAAVRTKIEVQRVAHVPLGFVSVSAQLNALVVMLLVLMGHL